MKNLILLSIIFILSGCAASNYGDPTRPDIRNQAKKVQRQNLQQYGNH